MRAAMPFSRWSVLPEKMISMRRISMPARIPPPSPRDHRISASIRMGKLRHRNGQQQVLGTLRGLRPGQSSKDRYRQAFAKA
jgi:hypothetical protein